MRTKEEIEARREDLLRRIGGHQDFIDKHNEELAALEAELAALPVEPVELVVVARGLGLDLHVKGDEHAGNEIITIFTADCQRHGIDPAALARFITTYTYLPRLMDSILDAEGFPRTPRDIGERSENVILARRYHAAMKGGAA